MTSRDLGLQAALPNQSELPNKHLACANSPERYDRIHCVGDGVLNGFFRSHRAN